MAPLRVAVLGGTGFVGKAVCAAAVRAAPAIGSVLSLSIHGYYPYSDNLGGSSLAHYREVYWPRCVQWRTCNVVDPDHVAWAEDKLAGSMSEMREVIRKLPQEVVDLLHKTGQLKRDNQ